MSRGFGDRSLPLTLEVVRGDRVAALLVGLPALALDRQHVLVLVDDLGHPLEAPPPQPPSTECIAERYNPTTAGASRRWLSITDRECYGVGRQLCGADSGRV